MPYVMSVLNKRGKRTMTDNEIIKAIEICAQNSVTRHNGLTYQGMPLHFLFEEILGFVNRQNSNIEELKSKNANLTSDLSSSREEVNKLEYTLLGVMHSVDKWLDGDELKQNEVDRAATMREKTLQIVEEKEAELESKHFRCDSCDRIGLTRSEHIVCIKQAKAEAVKEFAERLRKGINDFRERREMVALPYTEAALLCIEKKIDNLVKEFTE